MQDVESIEALQRQLAVHRRTLELLELQRAQFGAFTPPYIWHQFDETRNDIARIKYELRDQGIEVSDRPGDAVVATATPASSAAPEPDSAALLRAYQSMLLDQLRYLALAGMSSWGDQYRQLSTLYVDRTLSALAMPAAPEPGQQVATSLFAHASKSGARILIQGEPGSGKTTSLHAIALACAAQATGDTESSALAAAWSAPVPLPISLSGSNIAAALAHNNAAPNEQSIPTLGAFWEAIEGWLQYSNLSDLVPTIQAMLERGECIVLIDDIDGLPRNASEHAYMLALGRFVARYPLNRYVLSCTAFRPASMAPLASFSRFALAPPDQAQTNAMIERWYSSVADRAAFIISNEHIEQFQALLLGDERLRAFTRTPLTLVLSVLVHAEGYALPANRNLILHRLANLLLSGWQTGQTEAARQVNQGLEFAQWPALSDRFALVEALALALQMQSQHNPDDEPTIMLAEVEVLVGAELRKLRLQIQPAASACLNLLDWCCRNALLVQTSSGMYAMPNTQLREYLAGRALAAQPDFPTRAYEYRRAPHWRETLLHGVRELELRGIPHIARLFVRLLLHPPGSSIPSTSEVFFAATCLLEMRELPWANRSLRGEVRERLVACVTDTDLSVAERIEAGLLLGKLGHPRLAHAMPQMVSIPGGEFILGAAEGYDDERPVQTLALPPFAIAIYPVTNEEYARFLAAMPLQAPPHHWYDPRYNNPACPVVSVSWHDASAYCRWLTVRLRADGMLPAGQIVRLPTEEEWEKAASWDGQNQVKRKFPWGDQWSASYANTAEARGNWTTSPVGCYPHGASPYGLHDCVGNIWEWTASEYASYPGAQRSFREQGVYTLRGSSHATNPTHARCTYRSRLPAASWRNHLGFRIVIGAALPELQRG